MVHGQKTEKTEVVMEKTEQLSLFDEAETEATSAYPEKEIVVEKHARKAKRTHDKTRDTQLTDIEACTIRQAWIPVVLQDGKLENILCNRKLEDSIGEILELYDKSTGHIILTFDADVAQTLDSWCNAPF